MPECNRRRIRYQRVPTDARLELWIEGDPNQIISHVEIDENDGEPNVVWNNEDLIRPAGSDQHGHIIIKEDRTVIGKVFIRFLKDMDATAKIHHRVIYEKGEAPNTHQVVHDASCVWTLQENTKTERERTLVVIS